MTLEIRVEHGRMGPGFTQVLRAAAEATLQDQGIDDAGLAIVIVDETEMSALNAQYSGQNEPTDVLSFPDGEQDPDSGQAYLGDVFVCPPIAMKAAAFGRHSLLDELALLTVHGVLHLLHHDHDSLERRDQMWEVQSRILLRLGSRVQVP